MTDDLVKRLREEAKRLRLSLPTFPAAVFMEEAATRLSAQPAGDAAFPQAADDAHVLAHLPEFPVVSSEPTTDEDGADWMEKPAAEMTTSEIVDYLNCIARASSMPYQDCAVADEAATRLAALATRLSAQPADDARALALATAKMLKAGDTLSFAAQTSGGTAGRDDGLVEAIDGWSKARDAYKAICRIVKYEPSAQPAEVEAVEGVAQARSHELVAFGRQKALTLSWSMRFWANNSDDQGVRTKALLLGADRIDELTNHLEAALAVRPSGAEMRERAAACAGAWKRADALRLAAGEMTAQEMRTAQAVAGGIEKAILALPLPGDRP